MKGFAFEEVLGALPPPTTSLVEALVSGAERCGVAIHLVGGPVRDLLLGRPIRDVDLLVEPSRSKDARAVARAGAPRRARITVHERFGTMTIATPEASIDLATVRRESYRHPGALPRVEPGTLAEDLARRDFAVNAMALPLRRDGGPAALIDPHDGCGDVAGRRLRVLHARSFHDDPTRALRAARLGPLLGFALARTTHAALRDALRDGVFGAVSGDRLRHEVEKLFDDALRGLDPAAALRRLDEWHVLPALEPGLRLERSSVVPLRRLGRVVAEPQWKGPRFRPWASGLAVWLGPLPAGLRRRALDRLSVRGSLRDRIVGFPKDWQVRLGKIASARGRGAVDAILAGIDEEQLHALHAVAATPARRRILRWAAEDRARRLPVSGNDLEGIGLSGPALGQVLAGIRAATLDGAVANREEALALGRELGRNASRAPARKPARARRRARRPGSRP